MQAECGTIIGILWYLIYVTTATSQELTDRELIFLHD